MHLFSRRKQAKAKAIRESNALLDETNPYGEREPPEEIAYKLMELRQTGGLTSDMTSDIQAIELCAQPQCTACYSGRPFPCDPRDRNIYESTNFQNKQNTLRTFRSGKMLPPSQPRSENEFPPPPPEAHQDYQQDMDKCRVLDLIASSPKGTPLNQGNNSGYNTVQRSGSVKSQQDSSRQRNDRIPVDLTVPCDSS